MAIVQIAEYLKKPFFTDGRGEHSRFVIGRVDAELLYFGATSVTVSPGHHVLFVRQVDFGRSSGIIPNLKNKICRAYFLETKANETYKIAGSKIVLTGDDGRIITAIADTQSGANFGDSCGEAVKSLREKASRGDAKAKAALKLL